MEGETEHVIAHVLIQRQNGMERIAMGQISSQGAAICTNVKVRAFIYIFSLKSFQIFFIIVAMTTSVDFV